MRRVLKQQARRSGSHTSSACSADLHLTELGGEGDSCVAAPKKKRKRSTGKKAKAEEEVEEGDDSDLAEEVNHLLPCCRHEDSPFG